MYVDKARLEASQPGGFASLKNLFDIGDIVGARGSVKRTEKGELSVVADELQVCSVVQTASTTATSAAAMRAVLQNVPCTWFLSLKLQLWPYSFSTVFVFTDLRCALQLALASCLLAEPNYLHCLLHVTLPTGAYQELAASARQVAWAGRCGEALQVWPGRGA